MTLHHESATPALNISESLARRPKLWTLAAPFRWMLAMLVVVFATTTVKANPAIPNGAEIAIDFITHPGNPFYGIPEEFLTVYHGPTGTVFGASFTDAFDATYILDPSGNRPLQREIPPKAYSASRTRLLIDDATAQRKGIDLKHLANRPGVERLVVNPAGEIVVEFRPVEQLMVVDGRAKVVTRTVAGTAPVGYAKPYTGYMPPTPKPQVRIVTRVARGFAKVFGWAGKALGIATLVDVFHTVAAVGIADLLHFASGADWDQRPGLVLGQARQELDPSVDPQVAAYQHSLAIDWVFGGGTYSPISGQRFGGVVRAENADGRSQIFWKQGSDLYTQYQLPPVSGDETIRLSGRELLARSINTFAVARNSDGRLEVFFTTAENSLLSPARSNWLGHMWQRMDAGGSIVGWSAPVPLVAEPVTSFQVAVNEDGRLEVFYTNGTTTYSILEKDKAGQVHHVWQDARRPSGWAGPDLIKLYRTVPICCNHDQPLRSCASRGRVSGTEVVHSIPSRSMCQAAVSIEAPTRR